MAEYTSKVPLGDIPVGELFKREPDEELWIVTRHIKFTEETPAESESGRKRVWLSTTLVVPIK